MRAYRLGKVASVAALLGVVTAGGAFAQGSKQLAVQGELGVQAKPALTTEEQVNQAEATVRRATQLAERISGMLDEARREKDIMRANCLNRKLTEVNANTRNVEQRRRALIDAASAGDEGRVGHEFTVLTVLGQKLDSLDQESTQCLGQAVYEPGAAQVVTTVPENAPTLDPSVVESSPPPPPSVTVPPFVAGNTPVSPGS